MKSIVEVSCALGLPTTLIVIALKKMLVIAISSRMSGWSNGLSMVSWALISLKRMPYDYMLWFTMISLSGGTKSEPIALTRTYFKALYFIFYSTKIDGLAQPCKSGFNLHWPSLCTCDFEIVFYWWYDSRKVVIWLLQMALHRVCALGYAMCFDRTSCIKINVPEPASATKYDYRAHDYEF